MESPSTNRVHTLPFAVSDIDSRKQARNDFLKTVEAMQAQSVINGTDNISMDEINDIILDVSREHRRLANV
jgi:hypothetical protein